MRFTYRVVFDRIGRTRDVAPLVARVFNEDELAATIYNYARPYLGSREVDVVFDRPVPRSGRIMCGPAHNGGDFTVTELQPPMGAPAPVVDETVINDTAKHVFLAARIGGYARTEFEDLPAEHQEFWRSIVRMVLARALATSCAEPLASEGDSAVDGAQ